MHIEKIEDKNNYNYWNLQQLKGYVVYDILDPYLFKQVKKHTFEIFNSGYTNTFMTHGTQINLNNTKIKLAASGESKRYQNVIFDLTYSKNWWNQQTHTIKDYVDNQLLNVSPVYQKVIQNINLLPPFCNDPDKFVCFRLHLNVLKQGDLLSLHTDSNAMLYNTFTSFEARVSSVTLYLEDHIEGQGGEFWTMNGFVYKPKANSALILESGSNTFHGVTANNNDSIRLAFTTRWAHIDDLFLPGDLKDSLYEIDYDD
jgi:hypothetical protein